MAERFPDGAYVDVPGSARSRRSPRSRRRAGASTPAATSGTDVDDLDDEDFAEKLAAAHIELRELAARSATLEAGVDHVLEQLLER